MFGNRFAIIPENLVWASFSGRCHLAARPTSRKFKDAGTTLGAAESFDASALRCTFPEIRSEIWQRLQRSDRRNSRGLMQLTAVGCPMHKSVNGLDHPLGPVDDLNRDDT